MNTSEPPVIQNGTVTSVIPPQVTSVIPPSAHPESQSVIQNGTVTSAPPVNPTASVNSSAQSQSVTPSSEASVKVPSAPPVNNESKTGNGITSGGSFVVFTSDIVRFVVVMLLWVILFASIYYYSSVKMIKDNWPLYRCNPMYMPLSDDISSDFNYCIQNTMKNSIGDMLTPITYTLSNVTTLGGSIMESINDVRGMFDSIRTFVSSIVDMIYGVFINIILDFQRILINFKDVLGKIIAIVVVLMYEMDGISKGLGSLWNNPEIGGTVRKLSNCFHPNTLIQIIDPTNTANIITIPIHSCPLHATLVSSNFSTKSVVRSVMKIYNTENECFYKIDGESIYVTGSHYIFDEKKWIMVKDFKNAIKTQEISKTLYCLITDNHLIPIGNHVFWDWEDEKIVKK